MAWLDALQLMQALKLDSCAVLEDTLRNSLALQLCRVMILQNTAQSSPLNRLQKTGWLGTVSYAGQCEVCEQ